MRTHVAHSDHVDTRDAAEELVRSCEEALGETTPVAGLLFASVEYDHAALLATLHERWPGMQLVGGSSAGEFSSALGFRHDSVVLTVFAGDDLRVHAGVGRDLSAGVAEAVDAATRDLGDMRPQLCVTVFAPTTNASEVLRELEARLGDRLSAPCPVVGGLSGTPPTQMDAATQFHDDEVLRDSLGLLFLEGDLRVGWGTGSGWFPIGSTHRVTRASGHEVHEIDGQPALEIFERRYGAVPAQRLGEYPLAMYSDEEGDEFVLRAILDSEVGSGLLRFAGEVLEDARVRMTEVLPEGLLAGSVESFTRAVECFDGDDPQLALVISCGARKWVLGTKAADEIERIRQCAETLGHPALPIAGFYAFGEITPSDSGPHGRFHNETCVTLVLGR